MAFEPAKQLLSTMGSDVQTDDKSKNQERNIHGIGDPFYLRAPREPLSLICGPESTYAKRNWTIVRLSSDVWYTRLS